MVLKDDDKKIIISAVILASKFKITYKDIEKDVIHNKKITIACNEHRKAHTKCECDQDNHIKDYYNYKIQNNPGINKLQYTKYRLMNNPKIYNLRYSYRLPTTQEVNKQCDELNKKCVELSRKYMELSKKYRSISKYYGQNNQNNQYKNIKNIKKI